LDVLLYAHIYIVTRYTFGEDVEGTFSIYFESSDGSLRKEDIAVSILM